jgi:paraquat-inducible protein A
MTSSAYTESAPRTGLPPRLRFVVIALLFTSFLCNVAVLFTPFMDLRKGLVTEPYSLFRSVQMFWHSGLYVLAILVVAFSVVFPFAKLAVLSAVVATPKPEGELMPWLHRVERMGKWSMLDVFLVCLILVLTSRQVFVGGSPLLGIPLFIIAITLSMLAGELLAAKLRLPHETDDQPSIPPQGVWLLLSGLALAATLSLPFLAIRDWRMIDRDFSIITLVPVLWREGAYLATVLTAAFLVVAPVAAWILSFASWWRLKQRDDNHDLNLWAAGLRRWSMLEVFGLALAIFALEGKNLMHTEMRWGALLLVGTLALQRVFDYALSRKGVG